MSVYDAISRKETNEDFSGARTLGLVLQRTLGGMARLVWFIGGFGCGAVVMLHRLGGRHVGTTGPFESVRKRGQREKLEERE